MYDPRQSFQAQQAAYSRAAGTSSTKSQSSRSSAKAGKQAADTMRSAGVSGIGARSVTFPDRDDDKGSTYDYVPQTITTGLGGVRPTAPVEPEEKSVFSRAVDFFKSFGAEETKKVKIKSGNVYDGPMFGPYVPDTSNFGDDSREDLTPDILKGAGFAIYRDLNPDQVPLLKPVDNPTLNMFGVRRGSTRSPDAVMTPPSIETPANMDPMTRTLSQAMLPEPTKPTADYKTQVGDTLFSIQKTLKENGINTTVEEIAEINDIGLDGIFGIKPGTELKLPMPDKKLPTEFMDNETKAMLNEKTPVKAVVDTPNSVINIDPVKKTISDYISKMFGGSEDTVKPFTISTEEIKTFAKEMYDPVQAAAFVATFEAETGGGKSLVEKGYSKQRAIEVFVEANRRKDGTLSEKMKERKRRIEKSKDSKEIFNIVYGDRMGNTQPGDGFKYRGRGPIMLTGKNNYKEIGDAIGVDLVNNPDLLITDPSISLRATTAYLQNKNFQSVNSATTLANVVGHSNPKGKEGIRRWNKANKYYKEMYGKPMPTLIPKQRPAGLMEKYTIPRPQIRPENS